MKMQNLSKCLSLALLLICGVLFAQEIPLPVEMREFAHPEFWKERQKLPEVTKSVLSQSIELARAYILNHQKPEGNFVYSIDLETGKSRGKDNQVRQAGALWAVSLLNKERFNEPTKAALFKGIKFFEDNVKSLATGDKCTVYPEMASIRTGTVALFCLSLLDLLDSPKEILTEEERAHYLDLLNLHLDYLKKQELSNGSWSEEYDLMTGFQIPVGSPYFDGEVLLVYCKAARLLGREDLLARVQDAIPKLLGMYLSDCWKPAGDVSQTKGFYQWACLAFAEYTAAGWEQHRSLVKDAALALSWWMIYENDLEHRQGNTGYAVEGLVSAWRIAKAHNLEKEQELLKRAAMNVMSRLLTLQYKGPCMEYNPVLSLLAAAPPMSEGAIVNATEDLEVRIDTVQHQTHAMMLMLKYML